MRMNQWVDPLAQWLLDLRTVNASQVLLRGLGVIGSVAALLLASPGALDSNLGSILAAVTVACGLLVQLFRPDSDVGLLTPLAVVLLMAGQGGPGVLRAAAVGLCLLVAHMAFAIAATAPAHGVLSAPAWALVGRGALMVLAGSVIAGAVVVALLSVDLGPWMIVPGILAVIALFAVVLPRGQ